MSGFNINPASPANGLFKAATQPVAQQTPSLQAAAPANQFNQVNQAVKPPATAADQIKSQPLQGGQATQSLSFVDTPAPPTAADIDWAKSIEARAAKGEKIPDSEAAKYHAIADQLEASQPVPRLKPADMPPSARETQWAVSAETRSLSQPELAAYQNIAHRLLKADQEAPLPGNVTRAEMDWAKNLAKLKQTDGIEPTPAQLEIYTDIYNRSQTPAAQPKASAEEIQWAGQLKAHIDAGGQVSDSDKSRYLEIYAKAQPVGGSRVSVSELQWAMKLHQRAAKGETIEAVELDRYGSIQERLMLQDPGSIKPQDKVVSQHELDWANKLAEQVKAGIPATAEDELRYQAIYQRQVAVQ